MSEDEHYYTKQDEPSHPSNDFPKAAGGPWNVYKNRRTNQCMVAKHALDCEHRYGPTTWQKCWSYIDGKCEPAGGGFQC